MLLGDHSAALADYDECLRRGVEDGVSSVKLRTARAAALREDYALNNEVSSGDGQCCAREPLVGDAALSAREPTWVTNRSAPESPLWVTHNCSPESPHCV